MKILHTSDLQLDAPFLFLGEGGQRHREQLLKALDEIVEIALEGDYQLLLIAGDLFNSNHPQQMTVDFVLSLLGKLPMPICLLPGNHDPYDANSIYRRVTFPTNTVVFTDQMREVVFPMLDCAVYGNAVVSKAQENGPLEGLKPSQEVRWHIAMAHGNVVTGMVASPDRPIYLEEIENCGMDYVALGDWHSFADHSQGSVRACYSGAPEPTAFDQYGAGYVASVTLDERGCHVEKLSVGRVQAEQVSINLSGCSDSDVLDQIMEHAGESKMLEVFLSGMTDVGTVLDPDRLESLLTSHFYAVRIRDQSHPALNEISLEDFESQDVIGQFIRVMQGRIQAAPDEATALRTMRALQLGVALLQGKDVL
jgi:DNA repair exonuclease SbcCD nuclease subunit